MRAIDVLKRFHLEKHRSVSAVLRDIGTVIDEHSDPAFISNKIIADLGGTPVSQPVDAGIVARCLIEQAHILRDNYDAANAMKYAEDKVAKLRTKMPYIWSTQLAGSNGESKEVPVSDKKLNAQRIFLANQEKKNAEIARLIVADMGITESNASYYVQSFRKKK